MNKSPAPDEDMMYFTSDNIATRERLKSLGLKEATYFHHSDFVLMDETGRGTISPLRVFRALSQLRDAGDADALIIFNAEWDPNQHARFGDGLFYMDPARSTVRQFEITVDRVQTLTAIAKSLVSCPVTFTDVWMLPFWHYAEGSARWEAAAQETWEKGLQVDLSAICFQQWCRGPVTNPVEVNEPGALESLRENLERSCWWNRHVGSAFPRYVQLAVADVHGRLHTPQYLQQAVRACSQAGWNVIWWLRGSVQTGSGLVLQDNLGPDTPTGNRMTSLIEGTVAVISEPSREVTSSVEATA